MRIWIVRDAIGLYAAPSCWVAVASDEAAAQQAVRAAMAEHDLDASRAFTLEEIDGTTAAVHMLTAGGF